MTILSASELQPGMISVANIRTPNGQVLAPEGTVLTKQLINRIKLYSIEEIVVDLPEGMEIEGNDSAPASEPEPVVEQAPEEKPEPEVAPTYVPRYEQAKTHSQKVAHSEMFQGFQMDYYLLNEKVKKAFQELVDNQNLIMYDEMLEDIINIFRNAQSTIRMFDLLNQMRSISDSTYAHCLNVALICRTIGRWLHLQPHDLNVLTMAGLYHDLGKVLIPDEILEKPGKLTDEEFATIKNHPKLGSDILRSVDLDNRIPRAALMHHERCDGSGYPSGYTEDILDDFAMIVAIADVYDAMTAARSYRQALCPFQVIESFEREGLQKYNTKYLLTFMDRIATTYQSNRVLLSDARGGNIVMLNPKHLSRPMLQLDDSTVIDLAAPENKDLYILSIM